MRVLVLGGSEFMGRHVVEVLLARGDDVTVLNRGNVYWEPQPSTLKRITCNRDDKAAFTQTLRNSGKWDAVIDFSSFFTADMKACVEGLQGNVTTFVYISSDSTYMVCERPAHGGPRKEGDAVRPADATLRQKLNSADSYGDGKLQCEEVLNQHPTFPGVSLRLPDVFGPYDTTNRHWKYQLWLAGSHVSPVYIGPDQANKKLSFVYRDDVTSAALAAIRLGPAVHGKAFNIGCVEQPTLKEYLDLTAAAMGIKPHYSDSVKAVDFIPSVDFGPIDVSRALTTLTGWRPTPLADAVLHTALFFETAWAKYPNMRPRMKGPLKSDAIRAAIAQRYDKKT